MPMSEAVNEVGVVSGHSSVPVAVPEKAPSFIRRFLLRFGFAFIFLMNLPFPFAFLSDDFEGWNEKFWDLVVLPVAHNVFHVAADVKPNGSGDTTYNYIQVACALGIALIVAVIWGVFDRSRKRHETVSTIFRIYVRFTLAAAMVTYGALKVIPSQFPPPGLDRLVQPFGDASPMGLLWTFMGFSRGYEMFCGAAELLGGLLLTVRRTALLGALVSAAVLSNIVAMNFLFDVPVKLYSSLLLLMALIVAAPDLRRLANFFVLHRPVDAVPMEPLFRRRALETASLVVRTLAVVAYVGLMLNTAQTQRKQYGDLAPRSPLAGVWNVTELEIDGVAHPPLITDATRWRRVVFDSPLAMSIQLMSDERQRYGLKLDEKTKTITLTKRFDAKTKMKFAYSRPAADTLLMQGVAGGHQYKATCRRTAANFLLTSRGFHWIHELPFNR